MNSENIEHFRGDPAKCFILQMGVTEPGREDGWSSRAGNRVGPGSQFPDHHSFHLANKHM